MLTQYFNKNATATDADGVYTELKAALPATLTVLDKSAAEDKDALVMKKATRRPVQLKSIADLAASRQDLTVGGPPEWKTRPTGIPGLKKIYGLDVQGVPPARRRRPADAQRAEERPDRRRSTCSPPTRRIAANGLVALEDPKNLFAAQNVVPLITKTKVNATVIDGALNAVSAKLDTTTLADLVKEVVTRQEGRLRGGQGVPDQEQPRLSRPRPVEGSAG